MTYSQQMQHARKQIVSSCSRAFVALISCALFAACGMLCAQTGATGAISGTVTDSTGAIVVGAQVKVTNVATGDMRTAQTNDHGLYLVSLLPPGQYTLEVTRQGFKVASSPDVTVIVAETTVLDVPMAAGAVTETITVTASSVQLETESSELGRVTDSQMVANLPLVTRNYTQIVGLNPGVAQQLNDAGTIGRGSGSQGGSPGSGSLLSQGATSVDNNFQMNGLEVDDAEQTPTYSPGVPVPNPDTIQEFKVQTAQYDATSGRDAGAAVDLITKGGTSGFHASLFEYFRNEDLNANDWFSKREGQPNPVLRQNQYGFTASGPLVKNKVLLFGSWQGTKQFNALDPFCHQLELTPPIGPLASDRTQAALGATFAGDPGYLSSTILALDAAYGLGIPDNQVILANGSNITPQAVALFNAKLPNGQYVIQSPQKVNSAASAGSDPGFETSGSSFLSIPGFFNENQWMVNADYLQSDRNKIAVRYFGALSNQEQTLPNDTPGFGLNLPERFDVASISDTFILSPSAVNQFLVGMHRSTADSYNDNAFKFSSLGMSAPASEDAYPEILIALDGFTIGAGPTASYLQDEYDISDTLSWVKGKHKFTFGGGYAYGRDNMEAFAFPGIMAPLTWADFMLGQANVDYLGFSNIYEIINLIGDYPRDWRYKNGDAFIQDDWVVTKRLTLNLGLRYEHLGDFGDATGRMGNINPAALNTAPPSTGSVQGYTVPSNYSGGAIPTGVTKGSNTFGFNGDGQNVWNPRVGFAWMLPGSERFVLRGGVGEYHTSIEGQMNLQLDTTPPFGVFNNLAGAANYLSSDANPFPAPVPIPSFPAYSASTNYTMWAIAPGFRPPTTYHYSLGLQSKLPGGAIFDVSFAGARDLHMIMSTSINQAPLNGNGQTTNTVANIPLRQPYPGWTTNSMRFFKTEGEAWYNALEASLSQQWKHRLQYQASYTWARFLTPEPGILLGTNYSFLYGDQNNLRAGYGPDPSMRPQRFVLSAFYALPGPGKAHPVLAYTLGGWNVSAVALAQSGHQLGFEYDNVYNAYGISNDRPSFAAGKTASCLPTSGSVSKRVNTYINSACLTTPTVIGADGLATGFGNTPNGVLRGPDQTNIDLSLSKSLQVHWPNEAAALQLRGDIFDLLNHPNFSDPSVAYGGPAFGQITSMSSNPRVVQFSLRYSF